LPSHHRDVSGKYLLCETYRYRAEANEHERLDYILPCQILFKFHFSSSFSYLNNVFESLNRFLLALPRKSGGLPFHFRLHDAHLIRSSSSPRKRRIIIDVGKFVSTWKCESSSFRVVMKTSQVIPNGNASITDATVSKCATPLSTSIPNLSGDFISIPPNYILEPPAKETQHADEKHAQSYYQRLAEQQIETEVRYA
jgi:hypothetical protein